MHSAYQNRLMDTPEFLSPTTTSFHIELRRRINDYFAEIKSKPKGNIKLHTKAIILVVSFLATYIHLVFFNSGFIFLNLFECMLLGALTSAIGFNVMHDGAHGSFSQHKWLNKLAGLSLNFLGANVFLWKTKHNIVHHSFTNIEGMDDDINARPFLRLCESQTRYKIHRFQHLYFWFVYSILYIYWIFFADYKKYWTKKVGEVRIKKMDIAEHFSFWGFKVLHVFLFVAVPIYFVGWTPWLLGFLTYGLFAGFILSIVFQLAHTVELTHFPVVDTITRKIEDEWAVHQLKTTANFATKNKIVSWFTGGLNFQIEHHLFPNISHIHYPALSAIVQQVCKEYSLPYLQFSKVRTAIASHISHLKQMGKKR